MREIIRPVPIALLLAGALACGGAEEPPPAAPPPLPPAPVAMIDAAPPTPEPVAAVSDAGAETAPAAVPSLAAKAVAIPGVTPPLSFDYVAIDRAARAVWLPVGNTGSVDVYDIAAATFTRVDGFKTAQREWNGKTRTMGPSAASVGDGYVYVGNRATSEVCPIDAKARKVAKCLKLATPTDGVAYVARAKEVWVTTPKDQTVTVLDASKPAALKVKTTIKLDGSPEGYAVDDAHGVFFTNLEDKDKTVAIDIASHKVKSTWSPSCGSEGPRGIAVDGSRGFVFVACTDHLQVLDAGHDGAALGKLDTGAGVDNIDYLAEKGQLLVTAGKAAKAWVLRVDDKGQPSVVAAGDTAQGARNGVIDADGNVYVPAPATAQLLVLTGGQ